MSYLIIAKDGRRTVKIDRDSADCLDRLCRKLRSHGFADIKVKVVWS